MTIVGFAPPQSCSLLAGTPPAPPVPVAPPPAADETEKHTAGAAN